MIRSRLGSPLLILPFVLSGISSGPPESPRNPICMFRKEMTDDALTVASSLLTVQRLSTKHTLLDFIIRTFAAFLRLHIGQAIRHLQDTWSLPVFRSCFSPADSCEVLIRIEVEISMGENGLGEVDGIVQFEHSYVIVVVPILKAWFVDEGRYGASCLKQMPFQRLDKLVTRERLLVPSIVRRCR